MPDATSSAQLMQNALETELPPVRAMLEQARELHVVTEASDYRGTPTKLIDELLAELTIEKLVALARQTEHPIDDAVKDALAHLRGRLRSAQVPEDVLTNYDQFVEGVTILAEHLQWAEVARGLRTPVTVETDAASDQAPLSKGERKRHRELKIGFLGAGAGLLVGAYQLSGEGQAVLSGLLVLLGLLPLGVVVGSCVNAWRRPSRRQLQKGKHAPAAKRAARRKPRSRGGADG